MIHAYGMKPYQYSSAYHDDRGCFMTCGCFRSAWSFDCCSGSQLHNWCNEKASSSPDEDECPCTKMACCVHPCPPDDCKYPIDAAISDYFAKKARLAWEERFPDRVVIVTCVRSGLIVAGNDD